MAVWGNRMRLSQTGNTPGRRLVLDTPGDHQLYGAGKRVEGKMEKERRIRESRFQKTAKVAREAEDLPLHWI